MSKKKIGTVWLGGCSGCHMSLLDIDERLLEVVKLADIVKSPVVDGKDFPPVDIALVEGAISSEEHLAEIKHIRENAKILVAFGDCAVTSNVPSLRNQIGTDVCLRRAYVEAESECSGEAPSRRRPGRLSPFAQGHAPAPGREGGLLPARMSAGRGPDFRGSFRPFNR